MQKSFVEGAGRRMLALFLAAVMLTAFWSPASPARALSGTASYTPAESNIAGKYWVAPSASSHSETAALAVDGEESTLWAPSADDTETWFLIDLGGTYDAVRKTEIVFTDADAVYRYCLEGSSDGEHWAVLSDRTGNTRPAGGFTDLFTYAGLRYLKVTFTGGQRLGIREFAVINYLRGDLKNGSDMSELGSNNGNSYDYNANNNPPAPGYRGGVLNTSDPATGNNIFGLAKDLGWSVNRLRIWNSPTSSAATNCSPENTLKLAPYVTGSGLELAIDFHYADTWADPQHQPKPAAWNALSFDELVKATYDFTHKTISDLVKQGTAPTIVAIGNEITNGMMWGKEWRDINGASNPSGTGYLDEFGGGIIWKYWHEDEVTPEQYQQYLDSFARLARLVDAGIKAIRAVEAEYEVAIETEIHCAFNVVEGNNKVPIPERDQFPRVMEFITQITKRLDAMGSYADRIGISYYPDWHGSYAQLERNLVEINRYLPHTKLNISECSPRLTGQTTGDPNHPTGFTASVQSQGEDLIGIMTIINNVPNNVGQGIWTWAGSGQGQYGPVNFVNSGTNRQPYASMKVFKDAFATNVVESGVHVTTYPGRAPALPATVRNLDIAMGAATDVPVLWEDVPAAAYDDVGAFTVIGVAEGTGNMSAVEARVTVAPEPVVTAAVSLVRSGAEDTAVYTVRNETAEVARVACLLAVYDAAWRLLDVQPQIAEVGPKSSGEVVLQASDVVLGSKVRAFAWDAESLAPLTAEAQVLHTYVDLERYAAFQAPISVTPISELKDREDDFIRGMDVSSLWTIVQAGGEYFDMDARKLIEGDEISNALAIMKKHGTNWIRLRLWNDVSKAPPSHGAGGLNDREVDLIIAKKAHALGLKVLLNFHYSDTWADPGRQIKPTDWTEIPTLSGLCDAVYDFTRETLQAFADAGCLPEMVQIGNETNGGFMYSEMRPDGTWGGITAGRPTGSSSNEISHVALVKAGIRAVRDVDPNNGDPDKRVKVMYHLADGHNTSLYRSRATMLQRNNVDYDIMGASFYPYWHRSVADITATLTAMTTEFGKDVVIAETGWGFTMDGTSPYPGGAGGGPRLGNTFNQSALNTARSYGHDYPVSPQGQADELRAVSQVVAKLPENKGLGVFYWEPAWIPTPRMGSGWAAGTTNIVMANQAYFDFAGRALPSLATWNRLFPGDSDIVISLAEAAVSVEQGAVPVLPATVAALYADGGRREVAVTWNVYDAALLAEPGTFTIDGTVAETSLRAQVTVTVTPVLVNLLANPSFESTGVWTYGGSATRTNRASEAHDGSYMVNYYSSGANNSEGETYQTVNNLTPGTYTLTCWLEGDKYGSSGVLELFLETGDQRHAQSVTQLDGYLSWIRVELADVPVTNGTARVGLKNTRGGDAWLTFDDFSLTRTGAIS
jgi:arabinogalactan endo-1,4-beta-galactosidase